MGGDNSSLSETHAFLILNALPMVGSVLCQRLLKRFQGNVVSIFNATEGELLSIKGLGTETADKIRNWRKYFDLEKELSSIESRKIHFVTLTEPMLSKNIKRNL
jgi:ERCC4-type nuclease